jgi:hypothetical protein
LGLKRACASVKIVTILCTPSYDGVCSVLADLPCRVEVASAPHRQPDKLACSASPIDGLPCETKHSRRFLDGNSMSLCQQQERLALKTGEPRFGQWILAHQCLHSA